jgi:PAS domain S-box-containing protein
MGAAVITSPVAANAKVLVVDDHQENLVALRSILEQLDCQTMEATSGADALTLILRHEFAVILLDVMMPVMDGFETARYIRDRKASKHIPIIFLTANGGDTEYISKGYSEGAVDYLVKPIDPGIVKAKVAVFIELFRKEQRILRQEEELRAAERARGDAALRQSEALYEATFNHAPVGIAHADIDGRWLRVNDRICEILGYTRAELLQLTFDGVTYPEDAALDATRLHELLAGDIEIYRREKRCLRKDGTLVWVHVTVSLASSVDKEGHFIVIVEDISERKLHDGRRHFLAAASETLLSSLNYEVTVEKVAQLVVPALADWWILDIAFDTAPRKELVVAHSDPAKTELVRELGRRLFDNSSRERSRVFRARQPEVMDDIRQAFGPGGPDARTAQLAEEVGFASSMVVPLIVRESLLGTIMLAVGEPARRYRKADLAMAEDLAHGVAFALDNARLYLEARSAIDARDEFLSIAAHELRTPLTPLQITLQRLLTPSSNGSLETIPSARLKDMLARSERQVQRLAILIENLLDVSRITAGRIQLNPQEFDLVEVVREVVGRFSDELARAQCDLRFSSKGPVRGHWDRLRMEQVVTNLLANAIKYGACKPIALLIERANGTAVLTVRDEGIGIDSHKIPRLFGRFERAVSSRSYGGLGLGLYIARQIVEAHGGSIRVSSQLGVGSAFTVEVPLGVVASTASRVVVDKDEEQLNELGIASR